MPPCKSNCARLASRQHLMHGSICRQANLAPGGIWCKSTSEMAGPRPELGCECCWLDNGIPEALSCSTCTVMGRRR